MIKRRKNPNASVYNALQITTADGICCGDDTPVIVCDYSVTFDSGTLTAATQISLGGTVYVFSQSCATGTAAGRAALKTEIMAALAAAGYTQDGVTITVSGNNVTVKLEASQLVGTYLQSGSYPFVKSNCQATGDFKGGNCDFTVTSNAATSGTFIITPISTDTRITNIVVSDSKTGEIFDGPLVYATASPSGGAYSTGGTICIVITTQGYDNETITFTVTASGPECGDQVATISQAFPNV